jgi:type II secretory pathway pseudopilin PulG
MKMNKKGVTLTEMMVGLGIMFIIAGIGSLIYTRAYRQWRQQSIQTEVQQQARISLDNMVRNLQEAKASTVVISYYTGQSPTLYYSKISFTNVNSDTFEYYQQGSDLHQKKNGVEYQLTRNLKCLYFYYPNSSRKDLVGINVTMEKTAYESTVRTVQLIGKAVQIRNP